MVQAIVDSDPAYTTFGDHSWTEEHACIRVQGLEKAIKILHLTDTHVTHSAEDDLPYHQYADRMNKAYARSQHYHTKAGTTPVRCFEQSMTFAEECDADLLVLTGDIINNPSSTSVAAVKTALEDTNVEYLYTAGNHDWHYEGMEGDSHELRAKWRRDRLLPLYCFDGAPETLGAYSVQRGGLLFIAVDNSTYQIDDEQLEFFRGEISQGIPTVLLMHIPISTLSIPGVQCGHPEWGAKTDKNYIIERRKRWPESGNRPSTIEFIRMLAGATNLVAILAGHIHIHHTARLSPLLSPDTAHPTAIQYVTRAGAQGGQRIFDLKPAD